jgi:hypothetical protein
MAFLHQIEGELGADRRMVYIGLVRHHEEAFSAQLPDALQQGRVALAGADVTQ